MFFELNSQFIVNQLKSKLTCIFMLADEGHNILHAIVEELTVILRTYCGEDVEDTGHKAKNFLSLIKIIYMKVDMYENVVVVDPFEA